MLHCTHFIYYHTTMLWYHKVSLSSFFSSHLTMLWHKASLYSFIYYHATMLWYNKDSLSEFFFFPYNNVVIPETFNVLILFITIKQCCDTTKLHCPHSFSSLPTMFWHHKASLYFFIANNVVTPQSFIVLILLLSIKQCCSTTKLHCPHSFSSHPTILWHYKAS